MSAFTKRVKFAWDFFVRGKHRGAKQTGLDCGVQPLPLEAQLWFGSLWVANLHRMAPHQGTWFSEYDLRIRSGQGELEDQVLRYIAFCEDFHCRIAEGQDHDFDEFDRFALCASCASWSARLLNGRLVPMEGKMWFIEGGASWQHPQSEPSAEGAANEFWSQNTLKPNL